MGHSTTDRTIVSNHRQTWKTAIVWMAVFAIFLSVSDSAWAVRGRPHLDTTLGYNVLLSDNDTLLRGVSLSFDGGDPYGSQSINVPTQVQLAALATDYGLNTVHLYLEGDSTGSKAVNSIGYNAANCDTLVQRCANADLYLIITIGCNGENGNMDLSWSQDFWNFYGPRYKDETHVIYEAHNEPAGWTPSNWATSDWNNQIAMYNTIRGHAPNTFILLGSFMGFAGDARWGANYLSSNGVSWNNAGFAYHGYESKVGIEANISYMKSSTSYPATLCTEFGIDETVNQGYNSMFESHFNGWMQFQWLGANDWDLLDFKSKINGAGTVWTPDDPTCTWPAKGTLDIPADGSTIGVFSRFDLLYLTADPANGNDVVPEAEYYTTAGTDAFIIEYTGPRRVSLKAANGLYAKTTGPTDSLTANASSAGKYEQFEWIRLINGDVALRAYGGGGHLVRTNSGLVYPNIDNAYFTKSNFITKEIPSGEPPAVVGDPYRANPLAITSSKTVIEAEDFDLGGQGVAYYDFSVDNRGNGIRQSENVDIEICNDTGGGYHVSHLEAFGEWVDYTVDVTTARGDYILDARVATQNTGGAFYVRFKGINLTGTITVPNTGSWQSWDTTTPATITLDSGPQIMRFTRVGTDEFNVNKFTLTYIGGNGDMVLDGDIDMVDYALFAPYWQQIGCGDCGGAELTGDGNVLIEDLQIFCDNWMGGL
ncbi:MAG: carbohydrate-binding protein [Planctomycetota bacterium]